MSKRKQNLQKNSERKGLNQHHDELEKQQYDGEICDDQLNELYEQLD